MKDEVSTNYQPLLNPQHGLLSLVGIGPGDPQHMTLAAQTALRSADVVIGYEVYIDLVRSILRPEQEILIRPMGSEMERAQEAIDLAAAGRRVALISSGDISIYAMTSPVFEVLHRRDWPGQSPEVEVFPGISAVQAAAARLGAPLGHDFCVISLSDLLTPWPVIERRVQAAAWGDFIIGFYNPRSPKRDWQLARAVEILLAYRPPTTPVALARQVTRPDEQISLVTLGELDPTQVDMFTLVLVGNSQSYFLANHMVTPRGYESKGAGEQGSGGAGEEFLSGSPVSQSSNITYPVMLTRMAGVSAVVVGGGTVGERKVGGLLAAGIRVRLISPAATPQLQAWADTGSIEWLRRPYQAGDLSGTRLAFAATNRRAVNAQVSEEAGKLGLLCNVADQPEEGNFHVPAVHRRPGLVVAVNSTAKNPRQAQQIRDKIAAWLNKEE